MVYVYENKPYWLLIDLINIFGLKHYQKIQQIIENNEDDIITIEDEEKLSDFIKLNDIKKSTKETEIKVGQRLCGIKCMLCIIKQVKKFDLTTKEVSEITGASTGNLCSQKTYYDLFVNDGKYNEDSFLCVVFILINRFKKFKREKIKDLMIKKNMLCIEEKGKIQYNKHICSHCKKELIENDELIYRNKNIIHKGCLSEVIRIEKGLIHQCPKCKGEGKIISHNRGRKNIVDKCQLCHGIGYTKEKYKVITKVIGYEKA